MRTRVVALAAALLVAAGLGCNAVQYKYAEIESAFRGAALAPADATLGTRHVHYWEGGRGPAVLLVHGFGASAVWQWYRQVAALAPEHRVIVPDLLWFGESYDTAESDFGVDRQVEMLVALLDHLGERQVAVVGVSYGGIVATELAHAHPERVTRLALLDSPGRAYTAEDWTALCRRFEVDHMARVLIPSTPADIDRLLAIAYDDPPWSPDWANRQVLEQLYGARRAEKQALLDSLLRDMEAVRSRPARFEAPVLLIWGRDDPIFPLGVAERLRDQLGERATLHVIDRARHAPMLEHPEQVNALLKAFL